MICESFISNKLNTLSDKDFQEITEYILFVYGKVELKEDEFQTFIDLMKQDKKNDGSGVTPADATAGGWYINWQAIVLLIVLLFL